jgi:hypothetical protein
MVSVDDRHRPGAVAVGIDDTLQSDFPSAASLGAGISGRAIESEVPLNALQAFLDQQRSELHRLDTKQVRVGVEALERAVSERDNAPFGPGRIGWAAAMRRGTETLCKLRRELGGSEVPRTGFDLSAPFGAEALSELVEVELGGRRPAYGSKSGWSRCSKRWRSTTTWRSSS